MHYSENELEKMSEGEMRTIHAHHWALLFALQLFTHYLVSLAHKDRKLSDKELQMLKKECLKLYLFWLLGRVLAYIAQEDKGQVSAYLFSAFSKNYNMEQNDIEEYKNLKNVIEEVEVFLNNVCKLLQIGDTYLIAELKIFAVGQFGGFCERIDASFTLSIGEIKKFLTTDTDISLINGSEKTKEEVEFNPDEQREINKAFEKFSSSGGYVNPAYAEELRNYITAMALISFGIKLVDNLDYEKARQSVNKSLKIYPLPGASYLLAHIHFKKREVKKSIQLFKHFLDGIEIAKKESVNNSVIKAYLDFSKEMHTNMLTTAKEVIRMYEECQ